MKQVSQTVFRNTQITIPAGVTSVLATPIYPSNSLFSANADGSDQLFGITTAGVLYAWGSNASGSLGLGDTTARSSPVAVLGGLTFSQVNNDTGGSFTMGITTTGAMYSWGLNANGQLGVGDVTPRSSPVAVLGGLSFGKWARTKDSGTSLKLALSQNGFAYAWGVGANSQGVGNTTPHSSPVAVLGGLTFSQIYQFNSGGSMLGLTPSGTLYGWGQNTSSALAVGDVANRSSPVAVLGGLTFAQIYSDSGGTSIFGLTTSGTLYAWGANSSSTGQMGVGDLNPRSSPVAVLGGLTFSQIIINANTTGPVYGITNSGQLYAWGLNSSGKLGVGDTTNRSSPVAVLGGLTFSSLVYSSFSGSAYALTPAGVLYAWGGNSQGCLGVGDITPRSSPVAVLGGLTFTQIITTTQVGASTYGLTSTGALYAWGDNTNGQLGVGDVTPRSSPVLVLGGLTFSQIFNANANSMYGLTTTGALYAWGSNSNGCLGVGDNNPRSSPVAVLGGLTFATFSRPPFNQMSAPVRIPVVPGNSYYISFNPGSSNFGTTAVGFGPLAGMNLVYTH